MKLLNLFYFVFFIAVLFSCTNNPVTKPEENIQTGNVDSLSDEDFKTIFAESKAKGISDTTIKLETLTAQGPNKTLSTLINQKPVVNCTELPTRVADLIGGSELNIYKFDQSTSASASYMGFSGAIGKKEMLFIQDYIRYRNVTCGSETKKMGVGLRCFIHVKSLKGKISATLPAIAASVELSRARSTFSLKTLGFGVDGSVLAQGLSSDGDYNVDNFGKLAVTFNNVLKLLDASSTIQIQPVDLTVK